MKPISECTGEEILALVETGEAQVDLLTECELGRLSDELTELYQSGKAYNRELLFTVAERIREISCEKGLADSPNGGVLIKREAEALDRAIARWERNQKIFRIVWWIALPFLLAATLFALYTALRAVHGIDIPAPPPLPETSENVDWHGDGDTLEYADFPSLLAAHPMEIIYPRIALPEPGSAVLYSERLQRITLRLARATLTVRPETEITAEQLASEEGRVAITVNGYTWHRKNGVGMYTYDMICDGMRYTMTVTHQNTFMDLAESME